MKQSSHRRSCKDEPSKLVAYCRVLQYYFDEFAIGSTISMSPVKRNPWYPIKDIHRETLSIQPKTVEKATKQKCRMWFNINLGPGRLIRVLIYISIIRAGERFHPCTSPEQLSLYTDKHTRWLVSPSTGSFLIFCSLESSDEIFAPGFSSKRCKMCVGGHVFDT